MPTPRTIPTLANQSPGNFSTAALENTIGYAVGFFGAVPVFSGYQTATQSVLNNTYTSFTIDTETFDSDSGHSTVTNTSRYTPTVPGSYLIIGTSAWTGNATGTRRTRIMLNAATIKGGGTGYDVNQTSISGGLAMAFVAMNGTTDYVEVQGNQTSGGALSTVQSSEFACSLTVLWLST